MLHCLTLMVFFGEMPVFLQLSWIGLFTAKRDKLHLETPKLQEVFLSKTNTFLIGKQCARCSCSNTDSFSREIHVFLHLIWLSIFGKIKPFSSLKILICRKYSFQKLTQFSQGSNVRGDVASNIDGFLWRDTCVLQLRQIGLLVANRANLYHKHLSCRRLSFQKVT
jgi:hypothetical protein